jgi:hypothetical protein
MRYRSLLFCFPLVVGSPQLAYPQTADRRPYPMLEFFLAQDCIASDLEASTLLQSSMALPPQMVVEAYRIVSEARIDCAAGRVTAALRKYGNALAGLCQEGRPRCGRMPDTENAALEIPEDSRRTPELAPVPSSIDKHRRPR